MKKILFTILLVGSYVFGFSQNVIPSMKINISAVNTFIDPYSVTGKTLDFTSNWDATDIQVGDSLYMIDGNQLRIYAVASIISAIGTDFTITIDDTNNTGSIPPSDDGALFRTTTNLNFTSYVAGISETLQSLIDNRFVQRLDVLIGAEVEITTGVPAGSPTADKKLYINDATDIIYWNNNGTWTRYEPKIYGDYTDEADALSNGVPTGSIIRIGYGSTQYPYKTLIKIN